MTSLELKSIIFSGGSIIINAEDYSTEELKSIAFLLKSSKSTMTITNAQKLSSTQCKSIAFSAGDGNVIFDFTK